MPRQPNPVELRHPLVKDLFNIIDGEGFKQNHLAEDAGVAPRILTSWRIGSKPFLFIFEAVANAAGYDLKLVKRDDPACGGWMPMHFAKKDGTSYLLKTRDGTVYVGSWRRGMIDETPDQCSAWRSESGAYATPMSFHKIPE